jgi:hypothetical protein
VSQTAKKLADDLEHRFGIDTIFVQHLRPVLERFAASRPSHEERERVLSGIAAAYRLRAPIDGDAAEELAILVADFSTELLKIDESMKVLSAYLDRVQEQLASPGRLVH